VQHAGSGGCQRAVGMHRLSGDSTAVAAPNLPGIRVTRAPGRSAARWGAPGAGAPRLPCSGHRAVRWTHTTFHPSAVGRVDQRGRTRRGASAWVRGGRPTSVSMASTSPISSKQLSATIASSGTPDAFASARISSADSGAALSMTASIRQEKCYGRGRARAATARGGSLLLTVRECGRSNLANTSPHRQAPEPARRRCIVQHRRQPWSLGAGRSRGVRGTSVAVTR
jgi:hypothetical protein